MTTAGKNEAVAFAPATVANLSVGFDVLGLALDGAGDTVRARRREEPGVVVLDILGDGGKLPRKADENTAGIAAIETLALAGVSWGVELVVEKGLPIGSGMGSSAASAAAGAFAVNGLLETPLSLEALIGPCLEAEAAVAGRHADNIAPALFGGLCMVQQIDPLRILHLPVPSELFVVVLTPHMELSSRKARSVLPKELPLHEAIQTNARMGALVYAMFQGDLEALAAAHAIDPVTAARAPLIPGSLQVIERAMSEGALFASISGAGPSVFAMTKGREAGERVAEGMKAAFAEAGLGSNVLISPAKSPGARLL
ncbi:MAG: homoserine kinase [Myxococcales bacterium]|nr:homoserine kinase [Myxococcales bacterium]